jgi:Na+-translocating ferredoxin:NAD+ oxidoreductase RnfD subunit
MIIASTVSTMAPVASPTGRLARFWRTPRGLLALAFLPLLILGGTASGWTATAVHVGSAVVGACLVDLAIARIQGVAWRWPISPLLSGLIVAFVLGTETPRSVTLTIGALAILSRHLLTTRRGHIFNPAALALLLSIPLFSTGQSWWGALPDLPWPWLLVLLAGGVIVVDRVNKFPLVLSYLGVSFGLFTAIAFADPVRVAEMFRAPFVQATLFCACFMLTDPPTSPGRYAEQVIVGALVAASTCSAQMLGAGQAYLLIGLLVGNVVLAVRRSQTPKGNVSGGSPVSHPAVRSSGSTACVSSTWITASN